MTPAEILQNLRDNYDDDILTADGFEDAIIGVVDGACRPPVACYDYAKCVEILMTRDHMEEEDAHEYMSFNVTGAFVGDYTPLFVHDWRKEQEEVLEVEVELEEVEGLREQLLQDRHEEQNKRGQE